MYIYIYIYTVPLISALLDLKCKEAVATEPHVMRNRFNE